MSVQIGSGPLRHTVSIQANVSTGPDSMGAPTATWTTQFASVRAEIRPLRGDQYFAAQQMASVVDNKIRIRYHVGVKPGWRVLWGTRKFIINAVIDPEMRKVYLDLYCKEIMEAGS